MRIDSIDLFRVPLVASPPSRADAVESIFVVMQSAGEQGVGEAVLAAGPTRSAEWSAAAFACLKEWLAPALMGQTLASGAQLQDALLPFQGNARAKSALDMAWWNLAARAQRRPLAELLGADRASVPLAFTVDVAESIDLALAEIGAALEAGYSNILLKFRPGWDVQVVRAARQTYSTAPLAIDCDAQCTLDQQEMFYRLEDFFLESIEQPLAADDMVGHAMLQQSIRTPVCLDQSVTSLERVEQALDLEACRKFRIDVARVGGITPALAIRDACRPAKIAWCLGGEANAGVAAAAIVTLAASSNLPFPREACQPSADRPVEILPVAITESDGKLAAQVPAEPEPADIAKLIRSLEDSAVERATIA
jgi:o-succinylbenzoate synthase